jgi:hypothetical protein
MAKRRKSAQPPSPSVAQVTAAERALAERLFVKLYDPARGKTTEHVATEAIEAAKVFSTICPSLTKE